MIFFFKKINISSNFFFCFFVFTKNNNLFKYNFFFKINKIFIFRLEISVLEDFFIENKALKLKIKDLNLHENFPNLNQVNIYSRK